MTLSARQIIFRVAVAALVSAPFAVWALWKPIRVLAPSLAGVECYSGNVCTDDPTRLEEARQLRGEALAYVESVGGKLETSPQAIFCASAWCDKSFGFKGNAAYNFGATGLVVSSRGWQPYYVRHELIHCLQVERIGGFRMLLFTPQWLIEGMAYSVSEDPRRPLTEPWEEYRSAYEAWTGGSLPKTLWERAAAL